MKSLCRRFGEGTATVSDVIMTCGAAASVSMALQAVVNPGDEVIVIAPYFPEYKVWIEHAGAVCVEVLADEKSMPRVLLRLAIICSGYRTMPSGRQLYCS